MAESLLPPTSLLSPPPSPAPQNLSTQINIATRQVHTLLNKLIVSRLPLAIPPIAKSPELYAHGLNNFGDIYLVLENCWQFLIAETNRTKPDEATHDGQLRRWLCRLVPDDLWRSDAIKKDLVFLESVTGVDLEAVQNEKLHAFTEHIHSRTREKPHVLVAYAWVMYMAIFSGGRWIREQLVNSGPEFWGVTAQSEKMDYWVMGSFKPGFSLFCFDGPEDGEDIKAEFKKRLEEAEALLSERERKDIVEEGRFIFEQCIAVVDGLDDQLKTDMNVVKAMSEREPKHAVPVSPHKSSANGLREKAQAVPPGLVKPLMVAFFAFALFYSYKWQYGEDD